MIVIVDASAVGSFLLPDEGGPLAELARRTCAESDVHVPRIWSVEIANMIVKAERRKRIDAITAHDASLAAQALAATVTVAHDIMIGDITALALQTGLSAYDSSYAVLARQIHAPLLTGDRKLGQVARNLGIALVEP